MSIPNQTNLSDIINASITQTIHIITEISNLQSVVAAAQITKDSVKEFKVAMNSILMMFDCIEETMLDVHQAMMELNTLKLSMEMSSIIGNPANLIQMIRTGEISKAQDNSIFTQYVQLLEIAKQISGLAEGVSRRDIKRSSKLILTAVDMVSSVFLRLVGNSLFIKSMNSRAVEALVKGLRTGYRLILTELSDTLTLLMEIAEKGASTKKRISKGIRAIFSPIYSILNNMVLLGMYMKIYGYARMAKNLVLFAGLATYLHFVFDQLTIVIDNIQKIGNNKIMTATGTKLLKFMIASILDMFNMDMRYYMTVIAKTALFDMVLLPMLIVFFNGLNAIIDPVAILGENYIKMRAGIDALDVLLCGSRFQRSVISIIDNMDSISIGQLASAIVVVFSLNIIFTSLRNTVSLLIKMGDEYFNILKGRRALKLILLGGFMRKSIIDIIASIKHKEKELISAIPTILLLTTAMMLLGTVISQLILMGKNFRRIRRGIKAMGFFASKISDIIDNLVNISKKKALMSILVATLLNVLIVTMSVGMIILASIGVYAPASIVGMISILVTIGSLLLVVALLSRRTLTIRAPQAVGNLSEICALIGMLAGVMALMSTMTLDLGQIARINLSILLIVGTMVVAAWLTSSVSLLGLTKIILMTIPLLAIAGALQLISKYKFNVDNMLDLTKAIACLIPIILSVSLVALLVPLAIVGIVAMTVFVVGLIMISFGLMLLAAIDLGDLSKAEENAQKVFDVCHSILDRLMNTVVPKPEKGDGVFKKLVMNIGGPVVELIDSIFSMGYLVMMLVSVSAILLIAGCLMMIQHIKLDPLRINQAVTSVIGTAARIAESIQANRVRQNKKPSQPWWKKVLNALPFGGSITDLVDGIINMGGLAVTMISIGMISFIAKKLEYLGNLTIDRKKIQNNVSCIIETANSISSSIKDSISVDENVADFAQVVSDANELINNVNGLNIDKMKALANMFGNAAAFAKAINGNFDKLADAINEKLAPLIEDLKNAISDADKHAEERAKQKQGSTSRFDQQSGTIQTPVATQASTPAQYPGTAPAPGSNQTILPIQQPDQIPFKPSRQRSPLDEAVYGGVVKVVICDRNGNPKP